MPARSAEVGPLGVKVAPTLSAALAGADVALVLTLSGVAEMLPIVEAAGAAGVDVVSTCEDLAYADLATPELAQQLDARARAAGITVVGTGVNPGLVMDRLPLTLAAACVRVDRVAVTRVVDAAKRRAPLRAKVGAGLTVAEFEAGVAAKQLGHRGLAESCALVGLGLGFSFDEIRSTIGPVTDPAAGIEAGRVAGLRQSAVGLGGGRELVRLDLEMSVGAPEPHDRVVIEGDPPLDLADSRRHPRRPRHRRDRAQRHPRGDRGGARAGDRPRSDAPPLDAVRLRFALFCRDDAFNVR